MADTPSQVEPGLLDQLKEQVEKGREFAARPGLTGGPVRMWTGYVRHRLEKMFGVGSAIVEAWPTPQIEVPQSRAREVILERAARLEELIQAIRTSGERSLAVSGANRVFIGHGGSLVWREFKDFLQDRLALPWDEFNRESTAGVATTERLERMLNNAAFAFLIMTAEDEHADDTLHARENVVHEVGLFQGRLGTKRAIILKEEECQVFSNIHGLTYIGFPKNRIGATFEEIRRVLERERIIGT